MFRPNGSLWELTDKIHAAFYLVRREFGSGFSEGVYINSVAVALREAGIECRREVPYEVVFHGVPASFAPI